MRRHGAFLTRRGELVVTAIATILLFAGIVLSALGVRL